MSLLLCCRNITCRLGRTLVLDRLDFDFAKGDAVALVGSSGCGKTTLLRIIAGLETPGVGEVLIEGQLAAANGRLLIPPYRRGIAMLFQDLALWPNLSVAGNIRLGLSGLRLNRQELRNRVERALVLCEISELARRRPGTLSGGQQQRAALARALAVQPRLLLLDEPFGGLDLLTKRTVIDEIVKLKQRLGFALILVTHDAREARQLCRTLAVLENGRIVDQIKWEDEAPGATTVLGKAMIDAV